MDSAALAYSPKLVDHIYSFQVDHLPRSLLVRAEEKWLNPPENFTEIMERSLILWETGENQQKRVVRVLLPLLKHVKTR